MITWRKLTIAGGFMVISLVTIAIINASLAVTETVNLMENTKTICGFGVCVKAANTITCSWLNASDTKRYCSAIFEITNTNNAIQLANATKSANFLISKVYPSANGYTYYYSTTYVPTPMSITMGDEDNISYYNYTENVFSNWQPIAGMVSIGKGATAIKAVFTAPANKEDSYNLTLKTALGDFLLDPTISACSVLADNNVYTMTASITNSGSTRCMQLNGADNVTFDCAGYTIDGVDSAATIGIWLNKSNGGSYNVTIQNCTLTDWGNGIETDASTNITVMNTTLNSNSRGAQINNTHYVTMRNINANANTNVGLMVGQAATSNYGQYTDILITNTGTSSPRGMNVLGSFNNFTNVTSITTNGGNGINLAPQANGTVSNNTFMNCTFAYNTGSGISLSSVSGWNVENNIFTGCNVTGNTAPGIIITNSTSTVLTRYNLFYNNYINNTVDVSLVNPNNQNFWNATLDCTKTNIISGPCIGGNYWTDPDGNFSDNCVDANSDLICDSSYTPATNNTDYLALNKDTIKPNMTWNAPSSNGSFTANASWIYWNVSISETPNACILSINATTNYTMSKNGYCYYNMTGLANATTYCGQVYANDTASNMNISTSMCVTVNLQQETLSSACWSLADGLCFLPPNCNVTFSQFLGACWT